MMRVKLVEKQIKRLWPFLKKKCTNSFAKEAVHFIQSHNFLINIYLDWILMNFPCLNRMRCQAFAIRNISWLQHYQNSVEMGKGNIVSKIKYRLFTLISSVYFLSEENRHSLYFSFIYWFKVLLNLFF